MSRYSIDGPRLNRTLDELGHLGESPDGMDRVAYSPEDIAGRDYTVALMQQAGLSTHIDAAATSLDAEPAPTPPSQLSLWVLTPTRYPESWRQSRLCGRWQSRATKPAIRSK